jgi:cytochrome c biogenesis protein CcmG/thiol:disulfide interchange protein DsbE
MTGIVSKRLLAGVAAGAVVVVLAVGLVQLTRSSSQAPADSSQLTLAQINARLSGSPAPLATLHAQADQILSGGSGGGGGALRKRLAALHGYPIVIDKWASWCVPCQNERSVFQRASTMFGRQVAFVGIDSGDTSLADARAFLHALPVGYPSYYDQSGQLGEAITESSFTPVTVFYDRAGHRYIRQGPYPSAAKLERDIRHYALDEA